MSLIYRDNDRAFDLYITLLSELSDDATGEISIIVVQHCVPNVIPFIEALSKKFKTVIFIPKPNSINAYVLEKFKNKRNSNIKVLSVGRDRTGNYEQFRVNLDSLIPDGKFIIFDIGGYFSQSYLDMGEKCGDRLIGFVEDTENGHQKYMRYAQDIQPEKRKPVFSVARSPLKDPEDHLVGESIVYSIERILRDNNSLITNKMCLVLGYGKIGKSVANSLSAKNVTVWVYDTDPIRRAQALSHGYYTPEIEEALKQADLVVSATGQKSLRYSGNFDKSDFAMLKDGCFLASVTSADDEFDFQSIRTDLSPHDNKSNIEIFERPDGKIFYLLAKGNAVNFTHNNALGPYIYMVSCEIISCIRKLIKQDYSIDGNDVIQELNVDERREVAKHWMSAFLEGRRSPA
jgi:adenosylhomocysteinase